MRRIFWLPLIALLLFCATARAQESPFHGPLLPAPSASVEASPTPIEVASVNEKFNKALAQEAFHNPLYAQIGSTFSRAAFRYTTAPFTCDSSHEGWYYANTTTHTFNYCNGSAWSTSGAVSLPASASQGDLLYGSAANTYSNLAKDTNATRYLSNTGTSNNPAWAQVNLANGVSGTLPVANGGTGQTTAANAINALLPSQTSNSGKYLTTDGSVSSWGTISVPVTSVFGRTGDVVAASNDYSFSQLSGKPTTFAGYGLSDTSASLRTALTDENGTGVALFDSSTGATFITPNLGTPASGTLTNATGLPVSSGISGLGTGVATFLATPSSANLKTAVTDETGSGGALVFATSPTLTTPNIGAATATTVNGNTFTAGTYTLTGAAAKTLTFNNTLTFSGTDGTTHTFPSTSSSVARIDAAQTFTGTQTYSGTIQTDRIRSQSGGSFDINSGVTSGIGLGNQQYFSWNSNSDGSGKDTMFRRQGAANIAMGDTAAASPVAQTMSAQNGSGTDINGAARTDLASLQTGQGVPGRYHVQTGAISPSTGTTLATAIDTEITGASKVLSNNTTTTIINVTVASGSAAAIILRYGVEVTNGTDYQIEEGIIACHVTNKAGTIANNVCLKSSNQQATTSGTLTVTFTITAANPALLQVNANSSLTPSAGFPRLRYNLSNVTNQAVAIQ